MYDVTKETAATKKEIEIRGRYVMMACDIEYCLLNIINYCNPDPNNHERAGKFKKMKMAAKIDNVIADMKKYKPRYYQEFKTAFDGLDEFRLVRNDMAHSKGDFPNNPDFSIFRVVFVENDSTGNEAVIYREYTVDYIDESIDRFAKINKDLAALWMRLYKEYNGITA
jgi:hypothetical protein